MRIAWTEKKIDECDAALVVVLAREGGASRAFDQLDRMSGGALGAQAAEESFAGQEGRVLEWRGAIGGRTLRAIAVGLGRRPADPAATRDAVARGYSAATRQRARTAAVYLDDAPAASLARRVAWAVEGLHLASYRFDAYRSKPAAGAEKIRAFSVGVHRASGHAQAAKARDAAARGAVRAGAVSLCRDLVNEPASALGPAEFATTAARIARERGLACTVWDAEKLRRRGMRLVLAAAAGSAREPRLVHLKFKPAGRATRRVVLVGKGVTFDSGGLCIKQARSMADMKTDMAGGAVVLAAIAAAAQLRVDCEVHALIPLAENGVGPAAARPGDVVKGYSGTTVEIVNTDCEGRLLLADALAYAGELDADEIVDVATLTGACPVALGQHRAGFLASDEALARRFQDAAAAAGELVWRLPLAEELDRDLRSDVADVKNAGGRFGGAIAGGLFLKRFLKPETAWVHVDIAGPARAETATPLCPRGGSGYGVLTCIAFLEGTR
jgi:leucyl aminopeptidase